jgi:hypothetical protein
VLRGGGIGVCAVERSDGTVVRAENVDEVQELRKCDGLAAVGAVGVKDQGGLGGPVEVTVGEGVSSIRVARSRKKCSVSHLGFLNN